MPAELPLPIVALVTDRHVCGGQEALLDAVDQAVEGGVNLVQVREKDLSQTDLLQLARELRDITRRRALLFVNGDMNVALLARADGTHLGEGQSGEVRRAVAQGLVSSAVHDVEGAKRSVRAGAHLLVAGSVYLSQTHPGQTPAGPALIEQIAETVDVPLIGIGGITAATAPEVLRAGASGVAVIRAILAAPDPTAAARELRGAVDEAWESRLAPKEVG